MTAGSLNSAGTLTPFATAARTVSSTPDARGRPSMRMGFPSMYLDNLGSNFSSALLYADAAAIWHFRSLVIRLQVMTKFTFGEVGEKNLKPFAGVGVADEVFVLAVPKLMGQDLYQ
jgi:hypothetical protein